MTNIMTATRLQLSESLSTIQHAPFSTRAPSVTQLKLVFRQRSEENANERFVTRTSGNILLVDYRPESTAGLARILAAEGYNVRSVSQGAAALSDVTTERPDLFLIELDMPDLDGVEICR